MRGNACCIARGPPSPDGFPSRQINLVPVHQLASNRARTVSWSSRFSKPEDAAELHAIFADGDASSLKRRGAARSKLQKRFPRDSTLTNQRSQKPAVGNSDEEVARRGELKRIRARRLQEELGDVRVYDEDATPLFSSPFGQTSKSAADASDKDSQDDSVNNIISAYSSHRVDPSDSHLFTSRKLTGDTPHRSDSEPDESIIPAPPVFYPRNMPDIDDTSIGRTSWRLSFTSPHRSRCLRALSLSNPQDPSISSADLTVPTSEPLLSPDKKKWLNSEGRRSLESQQRCTTPDELTSRIGPQVPEKTPATPLHEMQFSQRLASAGTYIPLRRSSEYRDGTNDDEVVSSEDGFREINTRRSQYFRNISGSGFSESKVPRSWGQVLGDGTSSSLRKLNVDGSPGQTHESSPGPDLSLSYLQVPRIVITEPDEPDRVYPMNRRRQEHSGEGYSSRESGSFRRNPLLSTPPDADMNMYLQVQECSPTRNSVEPDQRQPFTPLASKLSEDFDEPGSKSSFRSSLLSAMRLSGLGRLTRSFDGEDYVEAVPTEDQSGQHKAKSTKNGSPVRTTSRKKLAQGRSKISSMESAEIMWTKAFRQSIDGVSSGAEFGERRQSPTSKRSQFDGKANNAYKQRNEQTLTDDTDSSRRSSQSTRSSFVIPPESWANFPSHTRGSRCRNSEPDTGVSRSDFAIRELLDGLHEDASATKKSQHKRQDSSRYYLPERLTMRMRTSFDRMLTKQNKSPSDTTYGHPSASMDMALNDLEAEIVSLSPRRDMNQKELQAEISRPIYQEVIPDAPKVPRRGSMDDLFERRGRDDDLLSPEVRAKHNRVKRREKYMTWSGRDKNHMTDMMALRQSTVDFMMQAQVMEKMERERALQAADEVLARSVVRSFD
ncbi:hypothetical protein V493_05710 [Pseudogymnoascus sp. VKM F-4281 (FW-2241)]|nr:hypothetical protein V493_05710 [Pseudogymnoascus sp. VKM F-4281 (FW-2241)]